MTLPKPSVISAQLDSIIDLAARLKESYRQSYEESYEPSRRGELGGTRVEESDPTGETAIRKRSLKGTLRVAAGKLRRMEMDLDDLLRDLGEDTWSKPGRAAGAGFVTAQELDDAWHAKQRRKKRGEL